tara:strand:- start:2030 stop:3202 length:1173 start_codon:yes stop_codon:yes gene_type:complete
MKYEFTIFGSGISAKITSSLLAKNGFKVCLITDTHHNMEVSNTNLVTFLSSGSINYLISMFPDIRLFEKSPDIKIIDCQLKSLRSDKFQPIKFNNGYNEILGKIIKNDELDKYFDEIIHQSSNIDFIHTNQLTEIENKNESVKLELSNHQSIDTDLFIMSSSKQNITEQIDVEFVKKDLKQTALSISINGKIRDENCAYQKFTSDGPLALLPYSKDQASVVWSLKNNSKILYKDNQELTKIIHEHLNEYISSVEIINIEKHKLQFVYAKNIVSKNTILLGNVAHNIHPIAGQGLNLSIKDIALFVKLINKYRSLGYKLNSQMALEEFETKRKFDNTVYSFGTLSLNSIFSSENKFINYATRLGMGIIENNEYLKKRFVKSASGKDFFESF